MKLQVADTVVTPLSSFRLDERVYYQLPNRQWRSRGRRWLWAGCISPANSALKRLARHVCVFEMPEFNFTGGLGKISNGLRSPTFGKTGMSKTRDSCRQATSIALHLSQWLAVAIQQSCMQGHPYDQRFMPMRVVRSKCVLPEMLIDFGVFKMWFCWT